MDKIDSEKGDFVIFQMPNKYVWIMLGAYTIERLTSGGLSLAARVIFYISGFVWAYDEIVDGANWFRRLLGIVIMIVLLVSAISLSFR